MNLLSPSETRHEDPCILLQSLHHVSCDLLKTADRIQSCDTQVKHANVKSCHALE